MKGRSFWQVPIPTSCSWSWKKILKLRDLAKQYTRFKVGDGRKVFLWLDQWHPEGYLLDRYGYRLIYDSGFPINSRLHTIIKEGNWYWPAARSDDLVAIQSQLHDVEIGVDDMPIWDSSDGKYSCADAWRKLRTVYPIVKWWKLVWSPLSIPKHSFFLWLVFRDALVTKYKMCCWGFSGNILCPFCYGGMESRDHLFFKCSFSCRIWIHIMADCSLINVPVEWDCIESWGNTMLIGKSLKACLGRLCLGATVYHLWRHRNDLIHLKIPRSEEAILAQIKWDVRVRVIAQGRFKKLTYNAELVDKWNLQHLM